MGIKEEMLFRINVIDNNGIISQIQDFDSNRKFVFPLDGTQKITIEWKESENSINVNSEEFPFSEDMLIITNE